jgi:hypothetical protein
LHGILAQPIAAPHFAVHPGDDARRGPHQCDRSLRHGRVAITLDQVHGDTEFGELVRVHVAARAGAEKHDVLQSLALLCDIGRQGGVIDNADLGTAEDGRPLLRRDVGIEVDLYVGIARLALPLENLRQ